MWMSEWMNRYEMGRDISGYTALTVDSCVMTMIAAELYVCKHSPILEYT